MSAETWELLRAAEAVARRELSRVQNWLWDGRTTPVPVELLADSHYGLRVEEDGALGRRLGGEGAVSGLLLPDERLIVVDGGEARRAPARRRFTVAHELGHWVLHAGSAPLFCRRAAVREAPEASSLFGYPPRELEANGFAAALLMPRELVLAEPAEDEALRAARLGVSAEALRRRLWALGNGL